MTMRNYTEQELADINRRAREVAKRGIKRRRFRVTRETFATVFAVMVGGMFGMSLSFFLKGLQCLP